MLASVDDRVCAKLQTKPGIKGKIVVGRHQIRIVVGFFRIDIVATRRLHTNGDIAIDLNGKLEGTLAHHGITDRGAPALRHLSLDRVRQSVKKGCCSRQVKAVSCLSARRPQVHWSVLPECAP